MKKWTAILLITALLLGCVGCSSVEGSLNQMLDQVGEELNKEITRGTIDGNVYTSEYSGVTFTKPDAWVYSTDEEIAQTMNITSDVLLDSDAYRDAVAKLSTVYDMMVIDNTIGTNVSVMYENLALSGNSGMSEEDYIEAVKTQLGSFTEVGYTFDDTTTMVVLSGEVYRCFTSHVSYGGTEMQQNYYVRSMGDFMHAIIVTLVGGTAAEDVEAMFS